MRTRTPRRCTAAPAPANRRRRRQSLLPALLTQSVLLLAVIIESAAGFAPTAIPYSRRQQIHQGQLNKPAIGGVTFRRELSQSPGTRTALRLDLISADPTIQAIGALLLMCGAFLGTRLAEGGVDEGMEGTADDSFSDPEFLKDEYKAREKALKVAIEEERELAAKEEEKEDGAGSGESSGGEEEKVPPSSEMDKLNRAQQAKDLRTIHPDEEELDARRAIVDDADKQKRLKEGLQMIEMAEAAKAEDEAEGRVLDATNPDGKIERKAREILEVEFAKAEADKADAERNRIERLEEGQRMLDMAAEARAAETDDLMDLFRKGNAKAEADASKLEDERLSLELKAAKEKAQQVQQQLKQDEEAANARAEAELKLQEEEEAEKLRAERVEIERRAADRRAQEERTARELAEEMARAEAARVEEARNALDRQRAEEADRLRAEAKKAEIEEDMEMVRKYAAEKKAEEKKATKREEAAPAALKVGAAKVDAGAAKEEVVAPTDVSSSDAETVSDADGTKDETDIETPSKSQGKELAPSVEEEDKGRSFLSVLKQRKRVVSAALLLVAGQRLLKIWIGRGMM